MTQPFLLYSKTGCWSGIQARLCKNPHKPPLPSIFMTNARFITYKTDEMKILSASNQFIWNCCVMIIAESWQHPLNPDAAIQLAGRVSHRQDRGGELGKSRGEGSVSTYTMTGATKIGFLPDMILSGPGGPRMLFRPFHLPS